MKYKEELDKITAEFHSGLSGITLEKLNFKADSSSWSIGEHIDHLIKINTSYFSTFEQIHAGKFRSGFIAKSRWLGKILGGVILKSVLPVNKKKQKTFPIWEPKNTEFELNIIDEFRSHQSELIEWIQNLNKPEYLNKNIYSPASRKIFYPLKMAFEIIIYHEQRHLAHCIQIKQVLEEK